MVGRFTPDLGRQLPFVGSPTEYLQRVGSGQAASDAQAEWLTPTLIEATLVWIIHRLRRFANVR
jgi:hypothetical protein